MHAPVLKANLLDFDLKSLQEFMAALGEQPFRAQQILKWIHQHGMLDFAGMTTLSLPLRQRLHDCASIKPLTVVHDSKSKDGTRKWLFALADGNCIETVFIPEKKRNTLCVSSQVGCALNCSFCATAAQGFNRNLTVGEIIAQLWHAVFCAGSNITNVVFMGMGEPLLNYDNVLAASNLMMSDNAYGLSKYRVTISTSGVVPALACLAKDSPVSLAVSLHAPSDDLREKLVPINKKYPLAKLMAVCRDYFDQASRSVTFEYVMLAGINDSLKHAKQLIKLLCGVRAKVNLIPFNIFPGTRYRCSSPEVIASFRDTLMAAGVITMVRKTRGDDIAGACGQLRGQFNDRTSRKARLQLLSEQS